MKAPTLRVLGVMLVASCASCLASERPVVIPVELVDGNNIATARVGDATLRIHIDTGGYKTLGITPAALDRLDVRFTSTDEIRTDGAGMKYAGRSFVIPEMVLGGMSFQDVPGFERKQATFGNFGGPAPFDAVIGRDFLVNYTVVVDYPNRRIELYAPDVGPQICGSQTTTMRTSSDGLWLSDATTDHGRFEMAWDTGAGGASFIQERLARRLGLPIRDDAYVTESFQIGQMQLGPMELVPIPLDGFPDVDGLIGISVFASHRVCFDFANRTVSLR